MKLKFCLQSALGAVMLMLVSPAHAQETWTSADRAITFTFPDEWTSVHDTDYALFYETFEDGDLVANCFADGSVMPSPAGYSQADYNAFIAAKTADSLDLPVQPWRYSTSRTVSGVRVLEYAYEAEEDGWPIDFQVIAFGLVRGGNTTTMSLTCAGPAPLADRESGDIDAILASLQIKG